jgi:nickel/cobalt transporter (NicO) family protein
MNRKWYRYLISFFGALLLAIASATPSSAHWADLSVAEIMVSDAQTQMTLTFPTGLVATADDNKDGQLSASEVRQHQTELERFLSDRIRLTDDNRQVATLAIEPTDVGSLPANLKAQGTTHSTLILTYTWVQPAQGLNIDYNLYLPNVPTARCVATILQGGKVQNVVFSPIDRQFSLNSGTSHLPIVGCLVALTGAFVWGAVHALSPGHGKTIVGAYLVGAQATPQHALFLGLTTTVTHTIGVFGLGLVTLFASRYVLAEQLYPWLSLASGLLVVVVGMQLVRDRYFRVRSHKRELLPHHHEHAHPHHHHHGHTHSHSRLELEHPHFHDGQTHSHHLEYEHHHHHGQTHSHHHLEREHPHFHDGHTHSHLPPDKVTWKSLLALGVSGGLVPCPSALVLLLSAIALGQVTLGLSLVLAFSLGLAATLTGLGLLLVTAKPWFERVPHKLGLVKVLPVVSAFAIAAVGILITLQALWQIWFPGTSGSSELPLFSSATWQQIGNFVGLGIEHILTGYDHVLFLISLLLLGGGIKYLLKVVTAFTVAHSITLSLAVLNLVAIPPRLVESAIALTIVYVAAENFWRKDLKGRWLITFMFGLIHGLGFAGILKEINIPLSQLPLSLASFNIGVEIGQIFIVSVAFMLLHKFMKPAWQLKLRYLVSAGVIAMGIYWFWERTFFTV